MLPQNQAGILLSFQPGPSVRAVMSRHLAPRTFSKVLGSLPLEGAVSVVGNVAIMLVNLTAPVDKVKDVFETGEIAYEPRQRALCIVLQRLEGTPMAPLGKVEDVTAISRIGQGWVEIRQV